ncbi:MULTISPECIES: hypothetical protein [unclassified Pseudoalteromonas]|uniref:hypothetical protein n=1 Tax=unclassified Pseudoalteromonas TaxID=194690 RepID=UPI001F18DFF0|nr:MULTISPECIES: hypothetical protein [unclassified Pseudoalteromonas]MCF2827451.1 hypothetical protein [Pseudoalteromonas sp. OF5H-5]MCF2830104.1 hypothetical protein [Pseudoalteromonas sp. DL2-H6]MCF2923496.1 hypothetical protein [Pseudoalteromonas sp. DL2-H1]
MNRVKGLLCVIVVSGLIAGCGGGSDSSNNTIGNSSGNQPIKQNGKVTFSDNRVEHHAFVNQETRKGSTVRVNVSEDIYNEAKNGKKLYFFIESSEPSVAYAELTVYTNRGYGILYITSQTDLTPGQYTSEVNLKGCYDNACTNEFGRAKLDYTVKIFEAPTIPESVHLNAYDDSHVISDNVEISFHNLGLKNHDWSASVTYEQSNQDWLTVEQSIDNGLGVLSFSLSDQLECGTYNANIQIKVDTVTGLNTHLTIPLKVNVDSQYPKITSVMPKVHYEGQPIRVVLNGCGLSSIDSNNLVVNGINVTKAKVENNYQIYLDAEPVSQTGDIIVDVKNIEKSFNNTITIKTEQNYSYQVIDLEVDTFSYRKSLFNPLNNTLYIEGEQHWKAIKGNGEAWSKDPLFAFSNIQDLELSSDNKSLLALKEGKLIKFDASTYKQTVLEDRDTLHDVTSLNIYNEDKILFGRDTSGSDTSMLIYSQNAKLFSEIDIETGYDPVPFRSRNGAAIFVSTYHYEALYKIEDQGKTAKKVSDNFVDNVRTSMSQDGKRILAVNALVSHYESGPRALSIRDENFNERFTLPVGFSSDDGYLGLVDATISDNGNQAYILYRNIVSNLFYVIKYDLSEIENGGVPEKVAATWLNESLGYYPQMKLSVDGNTLFIFNQKLVILPTSILTEDNIL